MDEKDFNEPELVSMEGEELDLLGMDENDRELLGSEDMQVNEFNYLNNKYPDLLGFYATAAKAGLGVLKKFGQGFRKIAQRIKARRAARKEGAAQAAVATQAEATRATQRAVDVKASAGKNSILIIGAIALIMAGVIMMKKKGKGKK